MNILPEHHKKYAVIHHKKVNPYNGNNTLDYKNPRIDRSLPREMTYSELIGAIEMVKNNLSSNQSPNFSRYNQKKIRMYVVELSKRIIISAGCFIFMLFGAILGLTFRKDLKLAFPVLTIIVVFYIFSLIYLEKIVVIQGISYLTLFIAPIIIVVISLIL